MESILAVFFATLALVAISIQLYFHKQQTEKLLLGVGQIDFRDKLNHMYVRVINKGLGPMEIYKLTFWVGEKSYTNIEHCLTANPKSYMHMYIDEENTKTLLPNDFIEVFDIIYPVVDIYEAAKADCQLELAKIELIVHYRDIHRKKHTVSRSLLWFARHLK